MSDVGVSLGMPGSRQGSGRRFGDGALSGAVVNMGAKVAGTAVSFVSLAILARMLTVGDYGLVAMVLSVTSLFHVFSDLGLSLVTVQRRDISQVQLSALFWINVGFGTLLGVITAALAPVLVWFFKDTRLMEIALVLALVFPLGSLGIQHRALLKRNMRFRRLAVIKLSGTVIGALVAIVGAWAGMGYWALVLRAIGIASASTAASWLFVRWRPGLPRRCPELGAMLNFGGKLTAHGLVGYFSRNLDKVLLGRFWGDHALGLYSIVYRLMMHPINLAGHSIGDASIPAMSRCGQDAPRMRGVYRRMFGLTCLVGLPACIGGAIWVDDVVLTLLGSQWTEAIPILEILFLAAIPRMLCASTGWVYVATGRPGQMLRWQLMWVPFVSACFVAGLPYGAIGVAAAYALANWVGMVPWFAYCFRGTAFSARDVVGPAAAPLLCTLGACGVSLLGQMAIIPDAEPGPVRLVVRLLLAAVVYCAATLAFVPLAREGMRKVTLRLRGFASGPRD